MDKIITIARKEIKTYFNSPIAYIVVFAFLLFTSVWFFHIQQFIVLNRASLSGYFGIMPIVFIIIIPALTMRSWAEENRSGTGELLLTLPFREIHLVLGKYAGTLALFGIMLLLTIPVPLAVQVLGDFEIGQIIGEYIGLALLGAAGIAAGVFVSSLTENQIVAFILTLLLLLFLTLVNQINSFMELPAPIAGFFNYLSLDFHFQSFVRGLIDTRDIFFFLLVALLFLYLNIKVLVFRKWR